MDIKPYTPPSGLVDRARRRIAHEWPVAPINISQPGGIVSFTFDDFPKSAAQSGADILAKHGVRGTYYASWRLSGVDNHQGVHFHPSDIVRLTEGSHEIGSHSYEHHDFAKAQLIDIEKDLARNSSSLADAGATQPLKSFAYPYGELTINTKRLLAKRFSSARGVRIGINGARSDMSSLKAAPIEYWRTNMLQSAKDMIAKAVQSGGWLIFYTHDVRENPSAYGVTPSMFDALVSEARNSGAQILTVGQASDLVTAKAAGAK